MSKLTKRYVEALKAKDQDYMVWDAEISGFGIRVYASGRKSYLVQYRSGGRTRRRSIGQHGVLTAEEARNEARKLLGDVAKGGNPAEDRQRQLRAPTVASLCDRFLSEYAEHHCKPSTRKGYEIVVRTCVKPSRLASALRPRPQEHHQPALRVVGE